jgi:hypothetical protein
MGQHLRPEPPFFFFAMGYFSNALPAVIFIRLRSGITHHSHAAYMTAIAGAGKFPGGGKVT